VPSQALRKKTGEGCILLHHLGCGLLVVAFVHLFSLYQLVSERLGSGFVAFSPLVLPVLFFAVLFFKRRRGTESLPSVFLGLSCCLAALAVPDPEIAVKRIHVMEYLLLSLYVRHTLAFRLSGVALLVFSCLLSCLYGVHDELLQGVHPSRTYGLRDMLVNVVAAIGGGLIWHGLALFSERSGGQVTGGDRWSRSRILYLLGLVAAVPAMAAPLIAYRHDFFPAWPFLPLAALMVVWSCFFVNDRSMFRHGLLPTSIVAFLFLVYPVAVNGLQITFN
jgi:VanZ family protein